MRTGDFDGDGVVDILTLHRVHPSSDSNTIKCYDATVHWCEVDKGSVAVRGKCIHAWYTVDSVNNNLRQRHSNDKLTCKIFVRMVQPTV